MKKTILLASPAEQSLGFRYCLFACVFLPSVLNLVLGMFQQELHILAVNMAYFCVNFAVLTIVFRRFLKESFLQFLEKWGKLLLTAAGCLFVYLLITFLMGRLISHYFPEFSNQNDGGIVKMTENSYFLTFFATVFLVPVAEECMYRASIFGGLYSRNRLLAYVFSTILFSLAHIDGFFGLVDSQILLISFLQYIPAGIILATAYDLSGSIFAPIFIHMAVNALGMLALR